MDQARRQINLKGKGDFEGISFRVDQESNGQLSIDFGGDTNYATLIQISQLISKIPVHESYFKPPKAGMLYNLTEEKGLKLSNNQLIALVNTFGFQLFSLLESPYFNQLEKYQSFSYHIRPQTLQAFSEKYGEILEKIKNK